MTLGVRYMLHVINPEAFVACVTRWSDGMGAAVYGLLLAAAARVVRLPRLPWWPAKRARHWHPWSQEPSAPVGVSRINL